MQNVGQQYGQGAASSHQGAPYGHSDSSSSSGSITSSLRQFRKKDVDKQQVNDANTSTAESHVARVAPHNHYPPRPNECYRYPSQFPDYSLSSQVKYSEISDSQPLQEQQGSPSVIQKAKGKDYMEMCNVQQSHMKQSYPDHLNGQQAYAPEPNIHSHAQYPHKDPQVHPLYKPESQYFPKEPQYQQLPHQIQKYNMPPTQIRKYPTENDFLSKLRRIHPSMARSIMSDHHLQESQSSYQTMDQNRMYPSQNQRYMNYSSSLQSSPYSHNYMPSQHYTNYPASCSYTRSPQMGPRFPPINSHERSISPRRGYADNLAPPMPPINYAALPQKISPNYPQYNPPEYAQHYQHRRAPQEYYQQPCRTTQYLPHQMTHQEMSENRVTVSDSIKQYIENWADEETASEMNQVESNRLCKENLRVRDDQSTETVYMINASELQYLENGIPLVASENGIPLVASENGQYIIKSGVAIDNSTGMVRIVEKTNQLEPPQSNNEGIVNLHIMDTFKPDCMLANKPNELNQRQNDNMYEKPKVVIHQNTVIQPGQQNIPKEPEQVAAETSQVENKIGNSLPLISAESEISQGVVDTMEKFDNIFKECKKETVDKNCSPINMEQMETYDDFKEVAGQTSVICPTKQPERSEDIKKDEGKPEDDPQPKNDSLPEDLPNKSEEIKVKEECLSSDTETEGKGKVKANVSEGEDAGLQVKEECPVLGAKHSVDNEKIDEENIDKNSKPYRDLENKSHDESSESKENAPSETKEKDTEEHEQIPQPGEDCSKEAVTKKDDLENRNQTSETSDSQAANTVETVKEVPKESEEAAKQCSEESATENKTASVDHKNSLTEHVTSKEKSEYPNSVSVISSGERTNKPKRTRRIFSVDDIINNIGTNINKTKTHKELTERRRSLQLTREFLEKEVDNSRVFLLKRETVNEANVDECKNIQEEAKEGSVEGAKATDISEHQSIAKKEVPESETVSEEEEIIKVEECKKEICKEASNEGQIDPTEDRIDNVTEDKIPHKFEIDDVIKECAGFTTDDITEESPCDNESSDVVKESEDHLINDKEADSIPHLNLKQTDEVPAQNEVQYRNAIRVEENSVLLEIAGELVEINVNSVNGKKVITVIPLSDTTVVDFNDNYETIENIDDIDDHTKPDVVETEHIDDAAELLSVEAVIPETDVIESTSEIIIGMDISLEEEIQLDLEKQPFLCTKAAKKAYDNDLQIPSITTSEDVNDSNKIDSYSVNDKVSSSKEQRKDKSEKKKSDKDSSKRVRDTATKPSKFSSEKKSQSDKNTLKELFKNKKKSKGEEEDFVPFKDLVKARKLKKQKLQQQKSNEKVSADSTNRIYPEENGERKEVDAAEKDVPKKSKSAENKGNDLKTKENKPKTYRKSSKSEEIPDECAEKNNGINEGDSKGSPNVAKEDTAKANNSCPTEKKEVSEQLTEKIVKRVTFGSVNYREPEKQQAGVKVYKLQDPRLKNRKHGDIIVPNVSEILKENAGTENNKKKLSLEEYNKRKRKLSVTDDKEGGEAKLKKITPDASEAEGNPTGDKTITTNNTTVSVKCEKAKQPGPFEEKTDKLTKMQRPKSLDDLKILSRPRDNILTKRKFSLEGTCSRPNHFDWEETQSPKTNLNSQSTEARLSEFSGLINNNKSKNVIDINDLNVKSRTEQSEQDEMLQIYKEQVDSKLSSLNIQIPRVVKPQNNILNPFSNSETGNLMERFLKNERITFEEMEKIRKIISYKRLVQQLNKIKSPEAAHPSLSPTYEIKKDCAEKDIKLHLKKVPDKKRKRRFRNLYSESTTESDSDFSETKKNSGDYSVVQSNCYAAGVPKLIIKRKTEMPVPVVRLERLDLDLLAGKKRKIY